MLPNSCHFIAIAKSDKTFLTLFVSLELERKQLQFNLSRSHDDNFISFTLPTTAEKEVCHDTPSTD